MCIAAAPLVRVAGEVGVQEVAQQAAWDAQGQLRHMGMRVSDGILCAADTCVGIGLHVAAKRGQLYAHRHCALLMQVSRDNHSLLPFY